MRRNIIPATLMMVALLLLANAASAQREPKLIIDITTIDGRPLEISWTLEGQGLRFDGTSSRVVVDDLPDGRYTLIVHLPHLGIGIGAWVDVEGVTRARVPFLIDDVTLAFKLDGVEPIRNAAVRLVTEGGKALEATTNELGEAVFKKLLLGFTYKLELRWDGHSYEKEVKIESTRLVINVSSKEEAGAPEETPPEIPEAPPETRRTVTVTATVTAWETLVERVTETVRVEVIETLRETATATITATAITTTTSVVEKEIIPGIPLMMGIIAGAAIAAAAILAVARKRAKEAQYYEGCEEYYSYEEHYEEPGASREGRNEE